MKRKLQVLDDSSALQPRSCNGVYLADSGKSEPLPTDFAFNSENGGKPRAWITQSVEYVEWNTGEPNHTAYFGKKRCQYNEAGECTLASQGVRDQLTRMLSEPDYFDGGLQTLLEEDLVDDKAAHQEYPLIAKVLGSKGLAELRRGIKKAMKPKSRRKFDHEAFLDRAEENARILHASCTEIEQD